ncbi:hypothetical protein GWK47_011470 [Chionoecetes opilio]|uniref:Uncharacterized protein n=1 Tax=Chionoecetes opilio TaxID=41210 RepID=A0A8J5CM97_CHIOP|nr:hypothetical protein GWK47_011470 [Chionoecetes opilio]
MASLSCKASAPSSRPAPTPAGPLPQWRIAAYQEATQYKVVRWLEDELKVALWVDLSLTGDYFLRGATWAAATTLQEIAAGQPRGIVLVRRSPPGRACCWDIPPPFPWTQCWSTLPSPLRKDVTTTPDTDAASPTARCC